MNTELLYHRSYYTLEEAEHILSERHAWEKYRIDKQLLQVRARQKKKRAYFVRQKLLGILCLILAFFFSLFSRIINADDINIFFYLMIPLGFLLIFSKRRLLWGK